MAFFIYTSMDSKNQASPTHGAHYRISPTAWGVAYRRTLSDIPFSPEIFEELEKIVRGSRSAAELEELAQLVRPEISPIFEARFKLVNNLLKENNIRQILEIAAGFSPRALDMARDPSVVYSELDLPGVIREKRGVMEALIRRSKVPAHANIHLFAGNVLNLRDVFAAATPFRAEPIAVVNEGLLRYLTIEERATVAANIRELLQRFGGLWITPDLAIQHNATFGLAPEKVKELNAGIEQLTGIEITKNYFENEAAARTFFESHGFQIERHSFLEVLKELVSPQKLGLSEDQVEAGIGTLAVFVMRLRRD